MSTLTRSNETVSSDIELLLSKVTTACEKIAPSWPLDQMIAVNPFWQLRSQHFDEVSAHISALSGAHCFMSEDFYLDCYHRGLIDESALQQAAEKRGYTDGLSELIHRLEHPPQQPDHWFSFSELVDRKRSLNQMPWRDEIIHQISQFCAAHYQQQKPILGRESVAHRPDLYRHWLDNTCMDKGIEILMSEPGLSSAFKSLPTDAHALIACALAEFNIDAELLEHISHALLLDINGWASYIAYLQWTNTAGTEDDLVSLLAIRLAWELAIWRYYSGANSTISAELSWQWQHEKLALPEKLEVHKAHQRALSIWAVALERTQQTQMQRQLLQTKPATQPQAKMQAVFCIDVRSEVIRRALEQQDSAIQTFGFAGFFGLPIAFSPQDTNLSRPQMPGLLNPDIKVQGICSDEKTVDKNLSGLGRKAQWQQWSQSATGAFSMVESAGWWYGFKLLKNSLFPGKSQNPMNSLSHHRDWSLKRNGEELTARDKAALAKGILSVLGIETFAETVLLVGHGSGNTNNLHAAGLDCGACCGQTGEVNVRVLASLLNDWSVRDALATEGLTIPRRTCFVAALHNTTTDDIHCFDWKASATESSWLEQARYQAQKERACRIDPKLAELNDKQRDAQFKQRVNDWSQVRPEWGLADNAAFIIAPRTWTKNVNLSGRSFLHDYIWQNDADGSILELLITAPMIVTHWINMQYNASVTDNGKYGSGNKVLHNAVGGNIGVFEGNGGDLRIGLPIQSVHDGQRWMHTPQRLSVYIAAPEQAIEKIVQQHSAVSDLINNEWLYLFSWDQEQGIRRFYNRHWSTPEA